ncbi:hypothetical protein F0562_029263 [Nyssa sinensis]|uniref:Wall-associated receptor kinase galacturonan-binding domain-containing protein n=1 Tax=Nyssa sinensis TaxID=561372 RepID=A0A5J5B0K1_9ASTE|nr:hypothetical protein F0562_029263 [Nyssa sinensis]
MNTRVMMLVLVFLSFVSFICVSALYACPKCGSMDVPYPLSTGDHCGNPKYRVYCNNGSLEFLSAVGFYYKILSINPCAYKFIIRPPLIQENTCQSSDLSLGGLWLDENSPFNISTRNTVMLLNCSENILLSPLNCSSNSLCRQFEEKVMEGKGCRNTLCCTYLKDASMTSHRIRIRVGGCSAYTSVVDIKPGDPASNSLLFLPLSCVSSILNMNTRVMMLVLVFLSFVSFICVSALYDCPKCGSMDVPYPLSTGDHCGNPKYRVYCNNGSLEFLSAVGFYYKILSINPCAYKFIIRPPLIQENTCQSSDLSLGGLWLDENSPFNISTHNTVMLLNCSENILLSPLNCSSNSLCRQFEEKVLEGKGCRNTLCCTYLKDASMTSHRIRIRVGGCSAYTSVLDIKPGDPVETSNYGVELQWLPTN